MAVYRPDLFPWLDNEIARLGERLAARRPTLGVCLGAQMIAAALGAKVERGPVREVGFAPVALTVEGNRSALQVLEGVPVLHWHGDGFVVPEGAVLLAETEYYPQAFALGPTILALQCHPEMGTADDGIEHWLYADAAYVEKAGTSITAIRADHARLGEKAAAAGRRMLGDWLATL